MAYKSVPVKTDVQSAISDAFSEFQSLAEEMRETYDNMEGANMGHMDKCVRAGEAADELEQHDSEPEPPDFLAGLTVETTEQVNRDKRKGPSRAVRLSNAQALLQAARDACVDFDPEAFLKDNESDVDGRTAEDLDDERDGFVQDLEEHTDFDVDFPGMFG